MPMRGDSYTAGAEELAAARRYLRLRLEHDRGFSELLCLTARACQAPVALLVLIEGGVPRVKAAHGIARAAAPVELGVTVQTLRRGGLQVAAGEALPDGFRFYAGMPLVDAEGLAVGVLCVLDRPRRELSPEQGEALRLLAGYATVQMELRDGLRLLQEATGRCRGAERELTARLPGLNAERQVTCCSLDGVVRTLQLEVEGRLRAQERLQAERDVGDQVINSLPGVFYLLDREGRLLRWNQQTERATGFRGAELAGRSVLEFFAPRDRPRVLADLRQEHGWTFLEAELYHRNGHSVTYYFSSSRIEVGGRTCICGLGIDVSERRAAEEALRLRERAIEASVDGVIITETQGRDNPIVYVNPAFERITGYREHEVLGRDPRFLQAGDRAQQELQEIRAALREAREGRAVLRNFRRNGTAFWNAMNVAPVRNEHGAVSHYVGIISDITESRYYQEQLEYHVNHDILTGLANRHLLRDRLNQAIVYTQRYGGSVAVILIDLDHFKFVNESLGHHVGDELLRKLAARLQELIGEGDTLARPGGDEFVLVRYEPQGEVRGQLLRQLLSAVATPVHLAGRELTLTASVGVSVCPQDGNDADTLLSHADAAMYRAKEHGRNNVRLYKAEMNRRVTERLSLEGRMRRALDRGNFRLHYQPQVDIRSGRIIGVEALLRWPQPGGRAISPARFIPLAEETGLIVPLGDWVLQTACAQNKAWQDAGLPTLPVAVNLSARQFGRPELLQQVAAALEQHALSPTCLEIELTESAFMDSVEEGIRTLEALKEMGIWLAVDDFGTGYSSLSYLKRFPVDQLKIDQSFVRDIARDPSDAAIARAVIALGHGLDLQVIAEGVETVGQLRVLRAHGCDQLQGYYFSPPLPPDQLADRLRQNA